MSQVTTIVMLPSALESPLNVEAFNDALALADSERGQQLRNLTVVLPHPEPSPSDHWGGTKVPEADVWGAALNYVSGDEVVAVARECQWSCSVLFAWMDDQDFHWRQATVGPTAP